MIPIKKHFFIYNMQLYSQNAVKNYNTNKYSEWQLFTPIEAWEEELIKYLDVIQDHEKEIERLQNNILYCNKAVNSLLEFKIKGWKK